MEYLSYFSENIAPFTGRPEVDSTFYPPRFSRKVPQWIEEWKIDREACHLFKKVYTALHNNLPFHYP